MSSRLGFICFLLLFPAVLKAQAEQPLFSVPFKLIDNRPFIEVKVNRRVYHFILDTGGNNMLDKAAADSLGINLNNASIMNGGAGRQVNFWMAQIDSMRIGQQKLMKTMVQVTDFSEIRQKLKLPYLDGIIGSGFMRNYVVQFDYPHGGINFYKSYTAPGGMAFSLYRGQVPQIRAQVDGNPAMLIFDTGERTALTLFSHHAEKTGISRNYKLSTETITGYGLGGPVTARIFTLKELKVLNKVLKNVVARIPTLNAGGFAITDTDGSIGGEVLKNYKLTIDYLEKKVYLE